MAGIEFFYHGTGRQFIEDIAVAGLDPNRSREPAFRARAVYLSDDPAHAGTYGLEHGAEGVLLRIRSADLDADLLAPDDCDLPDIMGEGWEELSALESLRESGQCRYLGLISGWLIEVAFLSDMPRSALGAVQVDLAEWRQLGDAGSELCPDLP